MNTKELREKRNALLDEMDKIHSTIQNEGQEKRNLTEKESEKYNELVSKISEIDVQLREAKKSKTTMEAREMEDNKKLEVRNAVEGYIRTPNRNVEQRAQYVNTTEDGSVVIPENIAKHLLS